MSRLSDTLSVFNRKERYWLLRNAIGESFENLGEGFRGRLNDMLGFSVPREAWWAMDYHFDWLAAGIYCYAKNINLAENVRNPSFKPELMRLAIEDVDLPDKHNEFIRVDKSLLTATQEDIDLIISFDETIILIEAKADSAWNSKQYVSKLNRMRALRNFLSAIAAETQSATGQKTAPAELKLRVRFLQVSPTVPRDFKLIKTEDNEEENLRNGLNDWLEWENGFHNVGFKQQDHVKPFMRLQGYGESKLACVTRCDENCTPDQKGNYWSIGSN